MRQRRLKAPVSFPVAHNHGMSRGVNRDFVFGPQEREHVVRLLREYEGFCGVRVHRDCPKTQRGPAARDFGGGQGGEASASPQRAATAEPTQATTEKAAARRGFLTHIRGTLVKGMLAQAGRTQTKTGPGRSPPRDRQRPSTH